MTGDLGQAVVANDELLARFVLFGSRVRADNTVKPEAFMPPPGMELSVSRHLFHNEAQLTARGHAVAAASGRLLVGRADVKTHVIREAAPLEVTAAPVDSDPGHANVVGWPAEKSAQKLLAQRVAAACTYAAAPNISAL